MFQVPEKDLIGLGIEHVIHSDSLEVVINTVKKRALGDPTVPRRYPVFIRAGESGKQKVDVWVGPLSEPVGSFLVIAERAQK